MDVKMDFCCEAMVEDCPFCGKGCSFELSRGYEEGD